MEKPPVIVIAYHSGRGHTEVLAQSVRAGALAAGAEVTMVTVDTMDDAKWEALDNADAIVFGAPTYMGSASGKFHTFAESTNKRWARQAWKDKLGSGFTIGACKAGDKDSTLGYFATLGAQHGMIWVSLGLLPGWHLSHESENDLNRLGYFNGAAATLPGDLPPDVMHKADIATAEHLGERVAQLTAIHLAGRAALAAEPSRAE
ncbi:MAG: flavodoxin family protein [Streptomyces sp.]|uniref:flavodoxin family protein n=1 Tax=Streptomyces sp. B93 TaxID=2824875 RepID=UPI00198D2D58|nr:flavodoxin family protein [Streptomyces sp. B93]MBC7272601.1 flavodoxin family protein [Streptomyces sp.]MBQ1090338.1 flavodoxin family protein [Streptomyces sp. B93]